MSREFSKKAEMKRMSDLICDMAVNGATEAELERVILYSAEVINSDKSGIDWRPLYEDYVIYELEDKYQHDPANYECKDYIVIDENYEKYDDEHGATGRGLFLGDFDTREEAETFIKQMDTPNSNLVIFGPKQKN